LRAYGYIATTTLEAGKLGTSDAEQIAFAASRGWAILTHNRVHFERLAQEYFTSGQEHAGIIIAVRRPPHEIVQRLLQILDQVTADEMDNQIRYI
ncbi:MAG: DUF5615 family PIN-like protein, partial [Planctomycetes bacterium]|nr:DUF5615 family PIN-like protein [Planctomycetota bacterium]